MSCSDRQPRHILCSPHHQARGGPETAGGRCGDQAGHTRGQDHIRASLHPSRHSIGGLLDQNNKEWRGSHESSQDWSLLYPRRHPSQRLYSNRVQDLARPAQSGGSGRSVVKWIITVIFGFIPGPDILVIHHPHLHHHSSLDTR